MTVIPLFCSKFLKGMHHEHGAALVEIDRWAAGSTRVQRNVQPHVEFLRALGAARGEAPGSHGGSVDGRYRGESGDLSISGPCVFPQTDAGQFTLNVKVPTGSRIEVTNDYVAKMRPDPEQSSSLRSQNDRVEHRSRQRFFVALYTNSGQYTATVQVELNQGHLVSSLIYMDRVRKALTEQFPDVRAFFQSARWSTRFSIRACPRPSTCR